MSSDNSIEECISETRYQLGDDSGPYLLHTITRVVLARSWNPEYNESTKCMCGHTYYRHFDTYEGMYPIGCKYCDCYTFELPPTPLKEV